MYVPAPAKKSLAVFKLPPVDQAPTAAPAPVHSSVAVKPEGPVDPLEYKAFVEVPVPTP